MDKPIRIRSVFGSLDIEKIVYILFNDNGHREICDFFEFKNVIN